MKPILDTRAERLLDISSAPIGFGYYLQNVDDTEADSRDMTRVGWWSRHRRVAIGVGMTLVTALGLIPAVQYAVLLVQS